MLSELAEVLICPACLPAEQSLRLEVHESQGAEVDAGVLSCPACARRFAIRDGIARLLPEAGELCADDKYEQSDTLSTYLWSHFADLGADADASRAYAEWSALLPACGGLALDMGCAVGRLSFELGSGGDWALGIDRSLSFVRAARRLRRNGELPLSLALEGELRETRTLALPERLRPARVEFFQADALALPFRRGSFQRLASLNLLDKLPAPRRHLAETDRCAAPRGASLLVSDPFSWSPAIASPSAWLGGTAHGPYAGRGLDNLGKILSGECAPPWRLRARGEVRWLLRNHANHFEQIRSHYLLAER